MYKRAYQFYCYVAIIIVYLVFTFVPRPNPALLHLYHLDPSNYRLIIASVAIPLTAIWLIAFYGFAKLQRYADTIKHNKDGKPIALLAKGIMYLVFQLPAISAISAILNEIALNHPRFIPTSVILGHYIKLAPPLVAFLFINYGGRQLSEMVKQRPTQRAIHIFSMIFIVVSAGFTYFAFNGLPARFSAMTTTGSNIFYLPHLLLFFTLIVPYIYMWFIGALAAYDIYLFQKKVQGILYQRSWSFMAGSLGWIIVVSIIYQYLTVLASHLTRLHVTAILLVVYALLILLAIGYVLMALGAKKLQKIEEV
jgi:hypothetical protein